MAIESNQVQTELGLHSATRAYHRDVERFCVRRERGIDLFTRLDSSLNP